MRPPDLRPLARATAQLSAAQAVGIAARLVYVALAARLLGPELYALLAWSQSWYLAFLPVALFGLGPALVYRMAAAPADAAATAASALALRLATTALAAAACLGLALALAPDARGPLLVGILLVALAGRAVAAWAQHLFVAADLNRHTLAQEAAFRTAEVAVALAVLLAGGGLAALVAVHAAAWAAQAAWALRVAARAVAPARPRWSAGPGRALVAAALPFCALQLLAEWRIQGPLLLFAGVTPDAARVGQFALAMQAMLILSLVPQALGAAAQPALTRSAGRGDGRDREYAGLLQRLAFAGGAAAGLCGLALGPPLFTAVFGPAYAEAGALAGLSLWCLVPVTAGFAWPMVFVARGELGGQVAQSVVATAALALLLPALAARLGAPGAVLAAGVAYAIPPVAATLVAARRGWTTAGAALLGPAAAALAGLGAWLAAQPAGPWVALPAALAALAAASALLGVLGRADLALLRGLAGR
jgi:O-antigen/teichoic acid export membrane protein